MKIHRRQQVLIASLLIVIFGGLLLFGVAPSMDTWRDEVRALGISLLTAGFMSLLFDRLALTALVGEVTDTLSRAVGAFDLIRAGIRSTTVGPFYTDVYQALGISQSLTIVQTWSPDLTNLLREGTSVVMRGGRIRVYLLHPGSQFARQRGIDLGPGPELVPGKIRSDTSDVRARYRRLVEKKAKGRLELYYYDALPAFALYATDESAWVGSYWYAAQSDAGPTLRIEIPSPTWRFFERHIEELHRRSVAVPLDQAVEPPLPQQEEGAR
jgi:hypothetical protein